ncbi:hypothetical protein AB6A23_11060 [Paenibacillus tarimensis]
MKYRIILFNLQNGDEMRVGFADDVKPSESFAKACQRFWRAERYEIVEEGAKDDRQHCGDCAGDRCSSEVLGDDGQKQMA